MFATRGDDRHTIYVDRAGIPVDNIINTLVAERSLKHVRGLYPVTYEEIFDCAVYFCDNNNPIAGIELEVTHDEDDKLLISTKALSDWVYLACMSYGHVLLPAELDTKVLYTAGLEQVVKDVMTDLYNDDDFFQESILHSLVHDSFVESYGELSSVDVELLVRSLGINEKDLNERS